MKKFFGIASKVTLAAVFFVCLCQTPAGAESFVRLAVNGKNVNLRPTPQATGEVVAQANAGDGFIAEKWPITNDEDGSEWYKIALALDAKSGKISALSSWDSRFTTDRAFVSAKYASISPLQKGDSEKISRVLARSLDAGEIPPESYAEGGYDGGFDWMGWYMACAASMGRSLPEIVQKWGDPAKIERLALDFLGQFVIWTKLEGKDGFAATFYEWPPLPGDMTDPIPNTSLQTLYVDREGAAIGGIIIGRDDKNRVRELLGAPDTENHEDAAGENWLWKNEFNTLAVCFGKNGRVSSVYFEARAAD